MKQSLVSESRAPREPEGMWQLSPAQTRFPLSCAWARQGFPRVSRHRNPWGCSCPDTWGNSTEQSPSASGTPQLPRGTAQSKQLCPTLVKFHFIALGEKKQQ